MLVLTSEMEPLETKFSDKPIECFEGWKSEEIRVFIHMKHFPETCQQIAMDCC